MPVKPNPHTSSAARIGLVIGTNQIGGAERQVCLLASGLRDAGIGVTVFFMSRPVLRNKDSRLDFGSVRCVHLWDSRYTSAVSTAYFAWRLRRERIAVLHMFNIGAMEYGLPAARAAGITHTVGSVRGILFSEDSSYRKRLDVVCRELEHLTCNCNAIRDLLVEQQVCPKEKIRVIHNGIIPGEPETGAKNGDIFTVLFVGTLKDVKDPDTFVKAALLVLETHPQCRFIMAGDGPLKNSLSDAIKASRFADHFVLLGSVPQELVPYAGAHLVMSTSRREGSSNSILEALANGIPVAGTAVGGTRELLSGGAFGRLFAPGDVQAAAAAISEFCTRTAEERERISREARSFIFENYSFQKMIENHSAFYQEITG